MYSSIEVGERGSVIKNCYWPLFSLAELGIPIGIEAPAEGVTKPLRIFVIEHPSLQTSEPVESGHLSGKAA